MNLLNDELRIYFARLRPIYCELFSMAHTILGNYELAEYAVQKAILEGWHRSHKFVGKLGFREGLRVGVKRIAYQERLLRLGEDIEFTWDGFAPDPIDGIPDEPFMQAITQYDIETRRILALRYSCGFSAASIAKLNNTKTNAVRKVINRFEAQVARGLKGSARHKVDNYCTQCAREYSALPEPNMPDPGTVFRTFQAEAAGEDAPQSWLRNLLYSLFCLLTIALLGGIFWLTAVLLQGPAMEQQTATSTPAPIEAVETADQTRSPLATEFAPAITPSSTADTAQFSGSFSWQEVEAPTPDVLEDETVEDELLPVEFLQPDT